MHQLNLETLESIEEVFGFDFHEWQVKYLLNDEVLSNEIISTRANGKTLVYIIKLLFSSEEPLKIIDLYSISYITDDWRSNPAYLNWFRNYLFEIYHKLNDAGIITRNIITARGELKNGR